VEPVEPRQCRMRERVQQAVLLGSPRALELRFSNLYTSAAVRHFLLHR